MRRFAGSAPRAAVSLCYHACSAAVGTAAICGVEHKHAHRDLCGCLGRDCRRGQDVNVKVMSTSGCVWVHYAGNHHGTGQEAPEGRHPAGELVAGSGEWGSTKCKMSQPTRCVSHATQQRGRLLWWPKTIWAPRRPAHACPALRTQRQHRGWWCAPLQVSHFVLRLAHCAGEDLRRWFIAHEADLFAARFRDEPSKVGRCSHLHAGPA